MGQEGEMAKPKVDAVGAALYGLHAIIAYQPREIVYDEFAYKRMVDSYRKAARQTIAAIRKAKKKAGGKWLTR